MQLLGLEGMAKKFVERAVDIQIREFLALDAEVIAAINDRDSIGRHSRVEDWLREYAVWQGYTGQSRRDVVRKIIEFADTRDLTRVTAREIIAGRGRPALHQ